ncbi:MAG TPA: hypothetical protein VG838_00545 [Opitutaceae bacterium]|nr:hypothetical protein [Opitutaceae bacterium]
MKARLIRWLLRQRLVQAWLLCSARPEASVHEVTWTKDEAGALAGWLETNEGKKFMLELENLKADADTNAILRSTPASAYGLVERARGVRIAVARIKALSTVRTEPDEAKDERPSLPRELEFLSDT